MRRRRAAGRRGRGVRGGRSPAAAGTGAGAGAGAAVKVKVCGVTRPEDAAAAAAAGAALVGLILAPGYPRSVAGAQAAEIAAAAREGGAEPVGVFVEEGAAAIEAACDAAGLRTAQLHGDGARAALRTLPERLAAIYAMAVDPAAGYAIATPTPVELIEAAFADADPDPNAWTKPNNWLTNGNARGRRTVDYLLLDGLRGGSGEALDWGRLSPPTGCSRKGWALAGGLHPGNVAEALRACPAANRPAVVDVSSGVCDASGLAKDHAKITAFLEQVALASSQLV